MSPHQTFTFGNTLVAAGLQLTYRNWQMYLRSLSHNSTSTLLVRVNLSTIQDQQRQGGGTLSHREALKT